MSLKKSTYQLPIPTVLALLSMVLLTVACSRKKDKWLNRNFHAMGTYYNIVYNGNLALAQGKEELQQNYQDNYWEILPVERMQVEEEVTKPGESKNQQFQRAEEKATKAIQKHNMRIGGIEHNPQMDEAFLLLGKARYFDQRFFPALEAFNYILTDYPESDRLVTAKIWREKTYMRMDNNELALENLQKLFAENIEFEEEDLTDASAAMAQAYLNLEEKEKAIDPLDTAIKYAQTHEEKGRYLFIRGQIYDRLGQIDSANSSFDKVIALKRKSPRTYMIMAYLEKAKNFDMDEGDRLAFREHLQEMEENRENRPYLDHIFFQVGQFYKKSDSLDQATAYYNKSLREQSNDRYLNSRSYLTLGNFNFDATEYKIAGAYYDSTLTNIPENTREYRSIKKKRENLDDVILYEDLAERNDSILNLVAMPTQELLLYFTEITEARKAKAIADAQTALKNGDGKKQGDLFGRKKSTATRGGAGGNSAFYFYNANQVAKGVQKFNRTWGNRELTDNWRYEASSSAQKNEKEENKEETILAEIENDPQYNPQNYLDSIPSQPKVIDSITKERNFAYYQLGVIYKEKFKEYGLAANKLETLLQNDPQERLVLPSKYYLYKIYEATENTAMAEKWKQNILSEHPDSRYASVLRNPKALREDESSPEAVYTGVYRNYQAGNYQEVVQQSENYIDLYTGEPIVPKFELLKATAKGKYLGLEAYKEGLNYVALTYPQSEEGKKAEQLIKEVVPELEKQKFVDEAKASDFKLVYQFDIDQTEQAEELQNTLNEAIEEFEYADQLYTSIDMYTPQKLFVVVHGLQSKMGAEGFGEKLAEEKDYRIKLSNFGIATENYKLVQIRKNLDSYLSQKTE